jgi:hypothetical protein
MAKPWERMKDEPTLWHGRFHSWYLMAGTERSIESAYQKWSEAKARSSGDQAAAPRRKAKPPGQWFEASSKWEWQRRAQAYDAEQQADERRKQRDAHYEMVKRAHQVHTGLWMRAANKAVERAHSINFNELTPMQWLSALAMITDNQRKILGIPLQVELATRPAESDPVAVQAAMAAEAEVGRRFEATPEMVAAVAQVLAAHEDRIVEPDGASTMEPPNPDGEAEVPHAEPDRPA